MERSLCHTNSSSTADHKLSSQHHYQQSLEQASSSSLNKDCFANHRIALRDSLVAALVRSSRSITATTHNDYYNNNNNNATLSTPGQESAATMIASLVEESNNNNNNNASNSSLMHDSNSSIDLAFESAANDSLRDLFTSYETLMHNKETLFPLNEGASLEHDLRKLQKLHRSASNSPEETKLKESSRKKVENKANNNNNKGSGLSSFIDKTSNTHKASSDDEYCWRKMQYENQKQRIIEFLKLSGTPAGASKNIKINSQHQPSDFAKSALSSHFSVASSVSSVTFDDYGSSCIDDNNTTMSPITIDSFLTPSRTKSNTNSIGKYLQGRRGVGRCFSNDSDATFGSMNRAQRWSCETRPQAVMKTPVRLEKPMPSSAEKTKSDSAPKKPRRVSFDHDQ